VRRNGVSPNDAYNLYLNYHMGHGAFARGRTTAVSSQGARRMQSMARQYEAQLRNCGRL